MRPSKVARAAGSGGSVPVECCQVCGHDKLDDVLSLGYMPPVNQMVPVGRVPRQQPWFPTNLLHCRECDLVQLGLAVDPIIIFPPEYPYTSGTTKLLRDNFADLQRESATLNASMTTQMTERFSAPGATLVKLFGHPREEADEFGQRASRVRDIGVRSAMLTRWFMTSLTLVSALAPSWPLFLTMRAAQGVMFAGLPAIAMASRFSGISVAPTLAPFWVSGKSLMFIAGEPMKPATKTLFGRS